MLLVAVLDRLKPHLELRGLQAAHNLVLCGGSLAMFLGILVELTLRASRSGLSSSGQLCVHGVMGFLARASMQIGVDTNAEKNRKTTHKCVCYVHVCAYILKWM